MSAIDWACFDDAVEEFYVKKDHTAAETLVFLEQEHGVKATLRQFKKRYSGKKNLTSAEWSSIASQLRKRKLENKDSLVTFQGYPVPNKKVKRELDRYNRPVQAARFHIKGQKIVPTTPNPRVAVLSPGPDTAPEDRITQETLDVIAELHASGSLCQGKLPHMSITSTAVKYVNASSVVNRSGICPIMAKYRLSSIMLPDLTRDLPCLELSLMRKHNTLFNRVLGYRSTQSSDPVARNELLSRLLHFQKVNLSTFRNARDHFMAGDHLGKAEALMSWISGLAGSEIQAFLESIAATIANNNLSEQSIDDLISALQRLNYSADILSILLIKNRTTQVLAEKLLKACIRNAYTDLAITLYDAGVRLRTIHNIFSYSGYDRDDEIVKLIIRIGPELLKGDSGGQFLLDYIDNNDRAQCIQSIINQGANLNWINHRGLGPLAVAVISNKMSVVTLLIANGADVNQKTANGRALVWDAIFMARWNIVNALISSGAKLDLYCEGYSAVDIIDFSRVERSTISEIIDDIEDNGTTTKDIIDAATKGLRQLRHFVTNEGNVLPWHMERALCTSILQRNSVAFGVLLRYGVDPNAKAYVTVSKKQLLSPIELLIGPRQELRTTFQFDIIAALTRAGADVNVPGVVDGGWLEDQPWLFFAFMGAGLDLLTYGTRLLESIGLRAEHNVTLAEHLLDQGVAVNEYGETYTGLQAAAAGGSLSLVVCLVDRGANVDEPANPQGGRTALQAALENTDNYHECDIVEFLIREGANVNAPPAVENGVTALEAIFRGRSSGETPKLILRLLLENGLSCGKVDGSHNIGILEDIVDLRDQDLVCAAIERGAKVNQLSGKDHCYSALARACVNQDLDMVLLLHRKGAYINDLPHSKYGRTALQTAVSGRHASMEIIDFLLKHKADINAPAADYGGITALQGAAIAGHLDVAIMLIKMGAKVNAPPALEEGRTAIEGAAEHGRLDMVQLLLNAGARGHPTLGYEPAISLAVKEGHFVLADMIREHVKKQETGFRDDSESSALSMRMRPNPHLDLSFSEINSADPVVAPEAFDLDTFDNGYMPDTAAMSSLDSGFAVESSDFNSSGFGDISNPFSLTPFIPGTTTFDSGFVFDSSDMSVSDLAPVSDTFGITSMDPGIIVDTSNEEPLNSGLEVDMSNSGFGLDDFNVYSSGDVFS